MSDASVSIELVGVSVYMVVGQENGRKKYSGRQAAAKLKFDVRRHPDFVSTAAVPDSTCLSYLIEIGNGR